MNDYAKKGWRVVAAMPNITGLFYGLTVIFEKNDEESVNSL